MRIKKTILFFILIILVSGTPCVANTVSTDTAGKCKTCHKEKSPGLYRQWFNSAHGVHNITCIDCHEANKGEPDSFMHYDALIATLVTPKDYGGCHEKEMNEVDMSHHAKAGLILKSADAYLANAAGGYPAAIQGCESCHGTKVKLDAQSANKLSLKSWPNSGIGRLNPDGSKGACSACHTRHSFSKAQARQPAAWGSHDGPGLYLVARFL